MLSTDKQTDRQTNANKKYPLCQGSKNSLCMSFWEPVQPLSTGSSGSKPWVSNYPLAALLGKKDCRCLPQRSEGCEFKSHPGPKLGWLDLKNLEKYENKPILLFLYYCRSPTFAHLILFKSSVLPKTCNSLYFFTAAQIVQVARPIWAIWAAMKKYSPRQR